MFMKRLCPVLIGALFLISATCHADPVISIVTTIQPLEYFIEKIGGKHVSVTTIIPPGGNPHTYEPTPGQISAVSKADLYVRVGSGLEFELIWMERLRALNKRMAVCDVSEGINLIEMGIDYNRDKHNSDHHVHGAMDPHIWLSPVNGIIIARNIGSALKEIDPENSKYYSDNTSRLINKLNLLIEEIRSRLKGLKKKAFLVFHPSWGYFARDFGLIQIPVEFAGKEVTPARLNRIIKMAKKEDIRAVFASPQFSKKSASVIANEINGKVIMIDPMKKDYIDNLRAVSEALKESMR
jgi:zinc transport system substrate-binding protein